MGSGILKCIIIRRSSVKTRLFRKAAKVNRIILPCQIGLSAVQLVPVSLSNSLLKSFLGSDHFISTLYCVYAMYAERSNLKTQILKRYRLYAVFFYYKQCIEVRKIRKLSGGSSA